jgi:hypothetical protein
LIFESKLNSIKMNKSEFESLPLFNDVCGVQRVGTRFKHYVFPNNQFPRLYIAHSMPTLWTQEFLTYDVKFEDDK